MQRFAGVLILIFVATAAASGDNKVAADPPAAATKAAAKAAPPGKQSTGKQSTDKLYTVVDGNKVDQKTLDGWKTWRALACERCHGAEQEGLVGPPLVDSLKVLSKEDFHTTIVDGRPEKGMPPFNTSPMVTTNWEGMYAYLKGRSDGKILPGRLSPIDQPK